MQFEKRSTPEVLSDETGQESPAPAETDQPEDDKAVEHARIIDYLNDQIDTVRSYEQDQIDLSRNIGFLALMSLTGTGASLSGAASASPIFAAALVGAGAGYVYGIAKQYLRQHTLRNVQYNDYMIQPLRASNDSEIANKGEIVAVVHSPQDKAGHLRSEGLHETLELLAEVEADKYLLRHSANDALLTQTTPIAYQKAINDVKNAGISASQDEVATVLNRQELVDLIETHKPTLAELQKTLHGELGLHFPALVPLLEDVTTHHATIRAALGTALAGRLSEPRQVSEIDDHDHVRIKNKQYFTAEIDTINNTYIIRNNLHAPDSQGSLSSLVDSDDEAMLLKKLKGRSLSEIELLALGLTTSLEPLSPVETQKNTEKESLSLTAVADLRRNLRTPFTRESLGMLRYPLIGVIGAAAVGAAVTAMPHQSSLETPTPEKNKVSIGKAISTDQPALHIRSHGLDISGYYAQQGFSHLDGRTLEWQETAQHSYDTLWYPTSYTLADPSIEIERPVVADEENHIPLPVKIGTTLASVQLTNARGKSVPFDTLRRDDGFYSLRVRTATDAPLMATYSLIEDTTGSYFISPLHPLEVSGPQPPRSGFNKRTSITQKQRHFQHGLTYDNTQNLEEVVAGTDASTLNKAVLDGDKQLANCTVAATILALDEVASGNKEPLALITGFNVSDSEKHGEEFVTMPHAWLADNEMPIIDPTPSIPEGKTEADVGLSRAPQEVLQEKWQDGKNSQLKRAEYQAFRENAGNTAKTTAVLSLAGLVLIAGRRRRQIARSITQLTDIVREKTFPPRVTEKTLGSLLAYEAYASFEDTASTTPELSAKLHWKALENTEEFSTFTVSDQALRRAAEGKSHIVTAVLPKSEQRQAQQRAKMLLRQRTRRS